MIAEMTPEHLDVVMEIENTSFATPWTREMFIEELQNEKAHYFVALENNKVVGYCGLWLVLDEGHIMTIAVSENLRSGGIGSILIKKMIEVCGGTTFIALEVRKSNKSARRLYEKFGFVTLGERKGYYNGEDAIIMHRRCDVEDLGN